MLNLARLFFKLRELKRMSNFKDGYQWNPTSDNNTAYMLVPEGYIVRYISHIGHCSLVFVPKPGSSSIVTNESYTLKDKTDSITIGELRKKLKDFPEDMEVFHNGVFPLIADNIREFPWFGGQEYIEKYVLMLN